MDVSPLLLIPVSVALQELTPHVAHMAFPMAPLSRATDVALVVPVAAVLNVTLFNRAVVVVMYVKSPSNPTRNFSPSPFRSRPPRYCGGLGFLVKGSCDL